MCITHTYITGKTLPGLISIQGRAPWPPPFPLLICVVGFIITLATHERTMLRNHLWALQCLAIRVLGIQMAGNNMHDREIHNGNAPAEEAGSWKERICSRSARRCVCDDRNNGVQVQGSCSWSLNLPSVLAWRQFFNAVADREHRYSFLWLFFSCFHFKKHERLPKSIHTPCLKPLTYPI